MSTVIKKVKTSVEHVWDLSINGTVVGQATATYKTPTQRTWAGSINVPLEGGGSIEAEHDCAKVEGGNSVRTLMNVFQEAIGDAKLDIPEPAPKVRKPRKKAEPKVEYPEELTRDMITPATAIELSKHYGYGITKKGDVERTGAEQAKYLRGLLDKAAKKAPVVETSLPPLQEEAASTEAEAAAE